jgi:hypothetical protein
MYLNMMTEGLAKHVLGRPIYGGVESSVEILKLLSIVELLQMSAARKERESKGKREFRYYTMRQISRSQVLRNGNELSRLEPSMSNHFNKSRARAER